MPRSDIYKQVAQLHIDNLTEGFLRELGRTFLAEMYRAIDVETGSTLITEEGEDGRVIGFVSGGAGLGPIYKAMFRRIWVWALPLGFKLIQPRRLFRVLDILKHSGSVMSETSMPANELYSIAVSIHGRGRGIAPKLYNALEAYFREHGVSEFRIIVGEQLAPAHGFYKKMGAEVIADLEVHKGEASKVYRQKVM